MKYTLKELRARKNLTQVETAEAMGVSTTTYNFWENNTGSIKMSNAIKLAELFEVEIGDIFFAREHQ